MLEPIRKLTGTVFVYGALVNLWMQEPSVLEFQLGLSLSVVAACLVLVMAPRLRLQLRERAFPWLFGGGCVAYLAGLSIGLSFVSTLGWIMLLRCFLPAESSKPNDPYFNVLPIAMLATPWIHSDISFLSAFLRDSTTSLVGSGLWLLDAGEQIGPSVLAVGDQTISIAAECDGRNALHAALIAGFAILCAQRRSKSWFVALLILLVLAAWVANLTRVVALAVAVANLDGNVSLEILHTWSGHFSVLILCALCYFFYSCSPNQSVDLSTRFHATVTQSPVRRGSRSLYYTILLCVCITSVTLVSHQSTGNSRRFGLVESACKHHGLKPAGFSLAEQKQLGAAAAVRYKVRVGMEEFLLTVVDGTHHRQAVHDPEYCWTVLRREEIPTGKGTAQAVTTIRNGESSETLYWYCSNNERYCSPLKYMGATCLRRISAGWLAEEPLLVLVTSGSGRSINWHEFLDLFPMRSVV